jgi:hypothetical protein
MLVPSLHSDAIKSVPLARFIEQFSLHGGRLDGGLWSFHVTLDSSDQSYGNSEHGFAGFN